MEEATETDLIEVREEHMVTSVTGGINPTSRIAHFLKPIVPSNEQPVPKVPSVSASSLQAAFEPKDWPLIVNFSGWRKPKQSWKSWVQNLEKKYGSLWEKAGIYDAILNSTCSIRRDYDLIIGIAEKWCPDTNTLVFPWGEATITLEDVMILGGYSVFGSPVFSCSVDVSREMKEIEDKLLEVGWELCGGEIFKPVQAKWMEKFMKSGSEIEHEAFLSLWLARYVFRDDERVLRDRFFPLAIHLARGVRFALAPAVLASIYRDLSLLKEKIDAATKLESGEEVDNAVAITLLSPFLLVQLWAWERFPGFQPKPYSIKDGDPRCALWDGVNGKGIQVGNVRLSLDSAGETFQWRPYANSRVKGWRFPEFFRTKGEWLDMGLNEDFLSFALCLRVSKLVGPGCTEQYLPHRVAKQFGMDQDIPDNIAQSNDSCECAWNHYIRPFSCSKIFVPSRLSKSDFSIGYLHWWRRRLVQDVNEGVVRGIAPRKRILRKKRGRPRMRSFRKRSNEVPRNSTTNTDNDLDVPPDSLAEPKRIREEDLINDAPPGFQPKLRNPNLQNSIERRSTTTGDISSPAQGFSIAKPGNGVDGENEFLREPETNIMHVDAEIGASHSVFEDPHVCKATSDPRDATEAYPEQPNNCNEHVTILPGSHLECNQSEIPDSAMRTKQGFLGFVYKRRTSRKIRDVSNEPLSVSQRRITQKPTANDVVFGNVNQVQEAVDLVNEGVETEPALGSQMKPIPIADDEDFGKTNRMPEVVDLEIEAVETEPALGSQYRSLLSSSSAYCELHISSLEKMISEIKERRIGANIATSSDKKGRPTP